MINVDCQGQGGGLALLWKNKNEVVVDSFSTNHIDIRVSIQGWSCFRLTGIYGESNRARRRSTWNLIRNLSRDNNLPWCLIGDMNNVLGQVDKRGGRLYPLWLIQEFQEVRDDCCLTDMKMYGYHYTWERGQGTDRWVEIRLDRALVSQDWLDTFQEARLTNLEVSTSDHCPLFLEPVVENVVVRSKRFCFENAWLRDPMCSKIVEDAWMSNVKGSFQDKITAYSSSLASWGQDITGNFNKRIEQSKNIIRTVRGIRDVLSIKKFEDESKRLTEVLTQKEVFWKQRSK